MQNQQFSNSVKHSSEQCWLVIVAIISPLHHPTLWNYWVRLISHRIKNSGSPSRDAQTEYSLPKVWVKLAHAYTADTRLSSSSSPPHVLLESLGMKPSKSFALLLIEVHEITDNFSGLIQIFVWQGGGHSDMLELGQLFSSNIHSPNEGFSD